MEFIRFKTYTIAKKELEKIGKFLRLVISISFIHIIICCCQNKQDTLKYDTNSKEVQNKFDFEKLKNKILDKGNDNDLMLLENGIFDNGIPYFELMPYSKFLIDNFNSGYSYDVYAGCLICLYATKHDITCKYVPRTEFLKLLNKEQVKEILYYFEKGASLKHNGCLISLREIYENGHGVAVDLKKADFYNSKITY